MSFTALHRAAGAAPGPLTDELLDEAIAAGTAETDDLDWKSALPPARGLSQTDFPKDVAAMANSGGGVIVYGVQEAQKIPTGRVDAGELDEVHERALRAAAASAIAPPVFGLEIHRLGAPGQRAVVVEVPASVDGPHLIFKGEYFGAPLRNDADTHWMRERQLEGMYRARFDERRRSHQALDDLYEDAAAGRTTADRAWLIGVAHPRLPQLGAGIDRQQAEQVLVEAANLGVGTYGSRGQVHPLQSVDHYGLRPGLRRWNAINSATTTGTEWKESWASLHRDGSVTLATRIGGHRGWDQQFAGHEVEAVAIEAAIADLMALVRKMAEATGASEYDVRVGIEWTGHGLLTIVDRDNAGIPFKPGALPIYRYTPVSTTVDASEANIDFYWHVHELALDCVNQGGVARLWVIKPPPRDDK